MVSLSMHQEECGHGTIPNRSLWSVTGWQLDWKNPYEPSTRVKLYSSPMPFTATSGVFEPVLSV